LSQWQDRSNHYGTKFAAAEDENLQHAGDVQESDWRCTLTVYERLFEGVIASNHAGL
jgi:hypothetical protein